MIPVNVTGVRLGYLGSPSVFWTNITSEDHHMSHLNETVDDVGRARAQWLQQSHTSLGGWEL